MRIKFILFTIFLSITLTPNLWAAAIAGSGSAGGSVDRWPIEVPTAAVRAAFSDQLDVRDAQDTRYMASEVFSEVRECVIDEKKYNLKFSIFSAIHDEVGCGEKLVGGPNLNEVLKYLGDKIVLNPTRDAIHCLGGWDIKSQWELALYGIPTKTILALGSSDHASAISDKATTSLIFALQDPALVTA